MSEESAEELPLGSYIVLRAEDGCGPQAAPRRAELRVVLCHGWLQEKESWLQLAQQLRDNQSADVLLFDYYAHGHSAPLRRVRMHTIDTMVLQVRRIMEHLGWDAAPAVFGGASLGASVALHYAIRYPGAALGLLLAAPSGLPDPFNPTARLGSAASRAMLGEDVDPKEGVGACSSSEGSFRRLRRATLAKLNLVKTTPCYGHSEAPLAALLGPGKLPATILLGSLDFVHSPQVATWKRIAPNARIRVLPKTHWGICLNLGTFGLDQDPLWALAKAGLDGRDLAASNAGAARSRL